MKFILFLTLVFILSVTACEKECIVPELYFNLIGFSDTEADTIVLRRFEKTTPPRQSILLLLTRSCLTAPTIRSKSQPFRQLSLSEYNYEIYFPEGGRLISVTNIIEEKRSSNKGSLTAIKNNA